MEFFKIDTDIVNSNNDVLMKIRNDIYTTMNDVLKYDVKNDSGFRFDKARHNIASNLNMCNNKIKRSIKYTNKVVEAHLNLYSKTCSMIGVNTSSNSTSSNSSSNKVVENNSNNISSKVKKVQFLKINRDLDSSNVIGDVVYSKEGILVHDNSYLISCNDSLGHVGDKVVMTLKDGRYINCIIGSVNDKNDGTVEFILGKNSDGNNIGSFVSVLQVGISKIVNNGGSK